MVLFTLYLDLCMLKKQVCVCANFLIVHSLDTETFVLHGGVQET